MNVMLGVRDKVVVIVGASGMTGKALAYTFAQNRAHTYFAGGDKKSLEDISAAIREKNFTATPIEADISGEGGAKKIVGAISERHSQIDTLVFNLQAEISKDQASHMKSIEAFVKASVPLLKRSRAASIISIAGCREPKQPDGGHDNPITGLTKRLAAGLLQYGIRANCIFSPEAEMEFNPDNHILAGRTLGENKTNPLDIANLALFFAMDDSFWINGQWIVVDGGLCLAAKV